jgi:hypothetical protein
MSADSLPVPSFGTATDEGTVQERSGYHQPGNNGPAVKGCTCARTTDKGAYRDVKVRYDGALVHFYHQSPVVVTEGRTRRLDSHGYRTQTTKDRINRYLPDGYEVYQEDYEWYLETPSGEREFTDGMTVTV